MDKRQELAERRQRTAAHIRELAAIKPPTRSSLHALCLASRRLIKILQEEEKLEASQ